MRIVRRSIPFILILAVSGFLFLGYGYARASLKSFISTVSKRDLGATVSIGHIDLGFPLSLKLKDVAVNDTIKADTIDIYPNLAAFLLNKKFLFAKVKINDPVIRIVRQKDSLSFLEDLAEGKRGGGARIPESPNFYFSKIDINNATFMYEDKGNKLELVNIKGVIEKPGFYFSRGKIYQFSFTGFLKNKDSDFLSPVKISGRGGLDSTIKANLQIKDVMLAGLGNLYLGQLGIIKGGMLDLKSDIHVRGNNLIAKCGLRIRDVLKDRDIEEDKNASFLASFVLLFNLKSKILKIKGLQGDFLKDYI